MAQKPDDKTLAKMFDNLKGDIATTIDEMIQLEEERSSINAKLGEKRATIKAKGVNMHAFKAAMAYKKLDEDQRKAFDSTYEIGRAAIGLEYSPDQMDLFKADEEEKKADDKE